MKTKILGAILVATLLVSVACILGLSFSSPEPTTLTKSVNSTSLTITNNQADAINFTVSIPSTISDGVNTIPISTSSSTSFQLTAGNSTTINIIRGVVPSGFRLGSYSSNIIVNAVNATNAAMSSNSTVALRLISGFCDSGSSTNASRYIDIDSVKDLSSDNDWEWKPADTVEIQVKVNYNNDFDSDDEIDAVIEVGLYDSIDHQWVDLDNEDEFEREVTLEEGNSATEKFTLDVPVEDIEDSTDRYRLYVKVYEDGKESSNCRDNFDGDYYQNVEIKKESYEVVLKNLEIDSPTICGEEVTLTATAWNIGNNDEDKVYVSAYNKDLGLLNTNTSVFTLDQGDSNKISMTFLVPKNINDKTYTIYLTTHYKYSKSSENYRESSTDPFTVDLKVEGCTAQTASQASITADFSSETPKAVIGNQVIIEAVVKNTGNSQATYSIEVSGNSQWAELAEIDPKTITLNAGESKKVSIYLNINKDASAGDEEFTIKAVSGASSTEQKVQLTLEKGFTGSAIINNLKTNWFIYLIILVNVILIIAIIIAIRRIFRKA